MCCGTEVGLEVVLTFPIKWSRFAHLRTDLSPRGGGSEIKAQDAAIHPNRNFGETLTHLWDPLSRQCFTHFALTSSHLYVASSVGGAAEFLATWRGKQSMEWRGGGRRAFVLLLLPLISPVPCVQAAAVRRRKPCPFARSLQMAYCAAIGAPPASSRQGPIRSRRRTTPSGASTAGSTQSIRWLQ